MKEKFIKSTITLIIGGFLTKILSMIIRIITTRIIGIEGIGLYMMIMPTYALFVTIASFSFNVAVSKLVSENTRNNKNVVLGTIPLAIIFNCLIVLIFLFLAKPISIILLKNRNLYYPIIACILTLPFMTISSIIRGYFFGKERMIPHVTSHIIEQTVRLILIILITPKLLNLSVTNAIVGIILFNIASEITSILILFFFLPKNVKIRKIDIMPDKKNIKDIIDISFPNTISRVINAFASFLEPVIITFVMLSLGYENNFITREYGIIAGFVFPMVMMPQFISGAISSALLPTITKYHIENNKKMVERKLKQGIYISLMIGIIFTTILMIFPEKALEIMFKTKEGANYLIIAAPIFLITYIEGPIITTLQATNNSKLVMTSSIIGIIIKTIILIITMYLDIKMYPLLISIFIQYIVIIIFQLKRIKKELR